MNAELNPAPNSVLASDLVAALQTYPEGVEVRLERRDTDVIDAPTPTRLSLYADDDRAGFGTVWDGYEPPRPFKVAREQPITDHENRGDDDQLVLDGFARMVADERDRQRALGYTANHDREHGIYHLLDHARRLASEGRHVEAHAVLMAAVDVREILTEEPTS
jgi:hypothetical protein